MPQTGQGGHAVVNLIVLPVAEWQKEGSARLAETTVSTSTGVRRSVILPDGTFTISMPWEIDRIPEDIGLVEGAEIADLRLLIGNSGKMYQRAAIVEKVQVVENVANDVVRCVVSGYPQGGWGAPVNV